jgi:hypothetical protein
MKNLDIILKEIERKGHLVNYHFTVSREIEKFFTTDTLFVEYDRDVTDVPDSILAIPFVSSLLAISWVLDCNLWVREIDKTFYDGVPNIREAYREIYDHFPLKGRFVPAILARNEMPASKLPSTRALLLFSGGADCQATFIRNLQKSPMLCNIQGWYKALEDKDIAADADKRDISSFAREYNVPTCFVRSNFARVISDLFDQKYHKAIGDTMWHGFLHSMAFIGIAIPVAYQAGISEIMIASSLTIGLNFYCASNLTTDSAFQYAKEGFVTHDGFELNRQGKMEVIVKHQKATGKPFFMRVCSFHDHNCCECEKCFRTILGIVAEGGDIKDFGFNIEGSLKEHWEQVLYRRAGLMSFKSEKFIHWPHIKKKMLENYDRIEDKEFVDWFLNFDFDKAKQQGLNRYYRQNFFSILKRKLHL